MRELILNSLPELPYAMEEAMNRLRINVRFAGKEIRKIMVVSTFPNEGKTLVASHLWRQMAEAEIETALIDMDLRKSVMTEQYGIRTTDDSKILGTSDILAGDQPLEEAFYKSNIGTGDILPNTENIINPSMLIEGGRFKELMQYAGEKYRYTILDAPPLGLVSDAEKIGSLCDGAILVVRAESTSRKEVRNSILELERAGCPLLGIVLNRVGSTRKGYYGKGYYGKYSDSYYGSTGK